MADQRRSRKRKKHKSAAALAVAGAVLVAAIAAVILLQPQFAELKERKAAEASASETVPQTTENEATPASVETTREETTPEETTPEETTPELKLLYTRTDVNVRTAPDTQAEILAKLPADTEVTAERGSDGAWTQVIIEGGTGYIASEYLTEDKDWKKNMTSKNGYADGSSVSLDPAWRYADYSVINSGNAVMYLAKTGRKDIIIGLNAGHGTEGGAEKTTYSHPDKTGKVTGGTNAYGSVMSTCVSYGMTFDDGTPEKDITLKEAQILKDRLLADGYDVLMIRDGEDVQLDNVARTVICNNAADCHISLHWDGDGLNYDKGCFFMAVPDLLKNMEPVSKTWKASEALGQCLIDGLSNNKIKLFGKGTMDMDLTQTSYSTVPSVDIELGNQSSKKDDDTLGRLADGLLSGINAYFGYSETKAE